MCPRRTLLGTRPTPMEMWRPWALVAFDGGSLGQMSMRGNPRNQDLASSHGFCMQLYLEYSQLFKRKF